MTEPFTGVFANIVSVMPLTLGCSCATGRRGAAGGNRLAVPGRARCEVEAQKCRARLEDLEDVGAEEEAVALRQVCRCLEAPIERVSAQQPLLGCPAPPAVAM